VFDPIPIARSPITPADPIARLDGWTVSGARSEAALRITDATPLVKIGIRCEPGSALAQALGVPFGLAARDAHGALCIGSGPGEWLVVGAVPGPAHALRDRLAALGGDSFATLIDLTSARALLRVTGASARNLLAKLCAIDLADDVTPDGAAFRSSVAKVVTDVIREDAAGVRSYWLHCEWSSGQYLFDACLDAGGEFDIETDGLRLESAKT
jgi:heterotetrameric sarcosine oxidase gamma subunit